MHIILASYTPSQPRNYNRCEGLRYSVAHNSSRSELCKLQNSICTDRALHQVLEIAGDQAKTFIECEMRTTD